MFAWASIARRRWPQRPRALCAAQVAIAIGMAASSAEATPPTPSAQPEAQSKEAKEAKEAKAERQRRALAFHDEAKALYDRGMYRRAIAKLEAALALDPEGKELVYNLAVIHEKLGELDRAEAYFQRYREMETDPKAREQIDATLRRIQGAKKSLGDGAGASPVGSGSGAQAPSSNDAASGTHAGQGLAPLATGDAAAPPPLPGRAPSAPVWIIGGVAVGALAVGIGFGVSAVLTQPNGVATGPGLSVDDLATRQREAHTQAIVADAAILTSIVAGAAAVVLFVVQTRPAPPPAAGVGAKDAGGGSTPQGFHPGAGPRVSQAGVAF